MTERLNAVTQVVVELKAKSAIHPIDKAQTLSHFRLTGLQVGLLINFHEVKWVDGLKSLSGGADKIASLIPMVFEDASNSSKPSSLTSRPPKLRAFVPL
ncbi:GxxExxY protein [Novipirellula aureliae]|uniref:GxxExxY protein n=1 Tax=Novipirellula aureliae TaxID=2527966 RepID=UPI001E40975E|nr:GxxExxY protein [Novipirellula aureliae]